MKEKNILLTIFFILIIITMFFAHRHSIQKFKDCNDILVASNEKLSKLNKEYLKTISVLEDKKQETNKLIEIQKSIIDLKNSLILTLEQKEKALVFAEKEVGIECLD